MPSLDLPRRSVAQDGAVEFQFAKEGLGPFADQDSALRWARQQLTRDVVLALGILAEHRLRLGGQTPEQIQALSIEYDVETDLSVGIV